jgi:predicted enzyme related to lactoylglutathione lyase
LARFDRYAAGQFSWVDLLSTDTAASTRFYEALFGWTHEDTQEDQGGGYTMFKSHGLDVAGMGAMDDAMKQAGVPPMWTSYVAVEDVETSTARAAELGAEVRLPPLEIRSGGALSGRMAILADPEGAAISLWQAGDHIGARIANEPGAFGWNELCSRNVPGAKRFYGSLFGWEFREVEGGNGYQEILVGDRLNGGILPWIPELGEMPPSWSVYFNVGDCDETVKRIQELGGRLYAGPTDIEPGRFAVVADPQGAVFDVMYMHSPDA